MVELLPGIAMAFWLGILTSISPCPLATNIAAISYVGQRVSSSRAVLAAGVLYTLGRTLVYVVLAATISYSTLTVPELSIALQKYGHLFLGPFCIVVGMFLTGLLEFSFGGVAVGGKFQQRVDALGIGGAFVLGCVFALAFCPTSAALFFGQLLAAISAKSALLMPAVYGCATGLPVLAFAFLIAFSAQHLGKAFAVLTTLERYARWITGGLFLALGVWFSLKFVFEVI